MPLRNEVTRARTSVIPEFCIGAVSALFEENDAMRKTLVLLVAGTALTILSAPVKADDLTIAVAGPMTGQLASIGDQFKPGPMRPLH